jgi:hypothetical protein
MASYILKTIQEAYADKHKSETAHSTRALGPNSQRCRLVKRKHLRYFFYFFFEKSNFKRSHCVVQRRCIVQPRKIEFFSKF